MIDANTVLEHKDEQDERSCLTVNPRNTAFVGTDIGGVDATISCSAVIGSPLDSGKSTFDHVFARQPKNVQRFLQQFRDFGTRQWAMYLTQLSVEERNRFLKTNCKFLYFDEAFLDVVSHFRRFSDKTCAGYYSRIHVVFKAGKRELTHLFAKFSDPLEVFAKAEDPAALFGRALCLKQATEFLGAGYTDTFSPAYNSIVRLFNPLLGSLL